MILCVPLRALRALDCFPYPQLGFFENEGLIRSDLFLPRILHSIHDGDAYTYSVLPVQSAIMSYKNLEKIN